MDCQCDDNDDEMVTCVKHAPMHVYSDSYYLYTLNIGKPICRNCNCWEYYANQLTGCVCNCHHENQVVGYDVEGLDIWARR